MIPLLLFALFWLLCGVLAYGEAFAYNQREWPDLAVKCCRDDLSHSLAIAAFGPMGIVPILLTDGWFKHGLLYRPSKR